VLHDHVPHGDIAPVQRQADILFLPLAFNSPIAEVIRTSAPGKTGEYLSVGKPILVHAPEDTFISWYFRQHQCGLVVDRDDTNLLALAITRLSSDQDLCAQISDRARRRAAEDFDVRNVQRHFVELLQSLGKGKGSSGR
jgi:glycosyltransferase involved in cell wall biosynthesis